MLLIDILFFVEHVGASVFVRLSHSCFYFKAFQASTGKRGAGGRTHPGPRRNEDNIWQHPRHLRGSHQNKGSVSSSKPSSTNIIMMVSFSERSLLTCYLCVRHQSDLEELLTDWSEDRSVGDIILKYVSTSKSLLDFRCWICSCILFIFIQESTNSCYLCCSCSTL